MAEESTTGDTVANEAQAEADKLMAALLERTPKGFSASSMGKFDGFRRWLADELGLDWKSQTYGVGSAGIAHNFGSRWTQNNSIAGARVPLGIAFLSVPPGVEEDDLAETALHTNSKFVNGTRSTSYEAILLFLQPTGAKTLRAHSIQTVVGGTGVANKLRALFPDAELREEAWVGSAKLQETAKTPAAAVATPPRPLDAELIAQLERAFDEANYRAPVGLSRRVVCALAAKPFLILAGLSGSGKTLLAIAVARWLATSRDQVEVVAVGADWTTTHHLLGYSDALDKDRFVRTPTLDLLIRASENPTRPYFLILDEMNLSHVERYFSDFLSAMESREPVALHPGPDACDGVPSKLALPGNLFVLGTINVDETTYMFSPKVIDRANVIEFTVTAEAMKAYLDGDTEFNAEELAGAGAGFGASLVDFVGDAAVLSALDTEDAEAFRRALLDLFRLLDAAGVQFGFRTAREMVRYAVASKQLTKTGWSPVEAIDAQISQRILPRMSGDSAKLRPPLLALLALMEDAALPVASPVDNLSLRPSILAKLDPVALSELALGMMERFPLSASKIARMLGRLDAHGFTTAIEG